MFKQDIFDQLTSGIGFRAIHKLLWTLKSPSSRMGEGVG